MVSGLNRLVLHLSSLEPKVQGSLTFELHVWPCPGCGTPPWCWSAPPCWSCRAPCSSTGCSSRWSPRTTGWWGPRSRRPRHASSPGPCTRPAPAWRRSGSSRDAPAPCQQPGSRMLAVSQAKFKFNVYSTLFIKKQLKYKFQQTIKSRYNKLKVLGVSRKEKIFLIWKLTYK